MDRATTNCDELLLGKSVAQSSPGGRAVGSVTVELEHPEIVDRAGAAREGGHPDREHQRSEGDQPRAPCAPSCSGGVARLGTHPRHSFSPFAPDPRTTARGVVCRSLTV